MEGLKSTLQGVIATETAETGVISVVPKELKAFTVKSLSPQEHQAIAALPIGSALLIARSAPEAGMRFLLDNDTVTVGRHPEADIFLDDVTVSRRHAEFCRADKTFTLVDTGSMNGTYVNGDRVDQVMLKNGAEIQIGKFPFTFYAKVA